MEYFDPVYLEAAYIFIIFWLLMFVIFKPLIENKKIKNKDDVNIDSILIENTKLHNDSIILNKIISDTMYEREVIIKAFDAISKEFEGREWLMEGRGTYKYDDDRYKQEVRYIMDAFKEIKINVWKEIKSKTFEYRNIIEKPLINRIAELEKEIEQLKNNNIK